MQTKPSRRRERCLDQIAGALPQRASTLTRFFFANARTGISRTEAALLNALFERPQRITELALGEGITQPAVTQLVNRLEVRGWVDRLPDPADGRAVLVELTDEGNRVFERLRGDYRRIIGSYMSDLDDDEVETLSHAVEILDRVIARLGTR